VKFYSTILNKLFDSAENLETEEKKFQEKQTKAKEEQEKLRVGRKARAKEVEDKFSEANALLDKFLRDYGSYHLNMTFDSPFSMFDKFFRF